MALFAFRFRAPFLKFQISSCANGLRHLQILAAAHVMKFGRRNGSVRDFGRLKNLPLSQTSFGTCSSIVLPWLAVKRDLERLPLFGQFFLDE
jgi:hypothetical protein